jgi:hypothetical protein
MRELNNLNKVILQKFASRQAYRNIKGHYIPIIWDNVSDESVMDIEKRKYYIQSYEFTMMGFLIDEDEFIIQPGIERVFQLYELVGNDTKRGKNKRKNNPSSYPVEIEFVDTNTLVVQRFYDRVDLSLESTKNVIDFDVYINGEYYGSNISKIQVNSDDVLKFEIKKSNTSQTSVIKFIATLS